MKLRSLILGMVLFLIIGIQVVNGVTVSNPVINPTGDLTAGTNVSVSFKIDMVPSGSETFPKDNTLQIFTDLNNAKWTVTMVRDGVEHPVPQEFGRSVYLSGWVLSYPSSVQESLRVALEGSVPSVTKSMNKTIVLVQELDKNNAVMPATIVTRERVIINPTDMTKDIIVRESDLQTFRAHIDNMTQMGVNTTAAEQRYAAARAAIQSAKTADFATAQSALSTATSLIEDGEKLLNKAWSDKEIENVASPLNQTAELITYFQVNKSITSDPRLAVVIAKKESAEQYLSSARDLNYMGNYEFSRVKAKEAFDKANESLTAAVSFKMDLMKTPGGVSWLNTTTMIIIGVVVVILANRRIPAPPEEEPVGRVLTFFFKSTPCCGGIASFSSAEYFKNRGFSLPGACCRPHDRNFRDPTPRHDSLSPCPLTGLNPGSFNKVCGEGERPLRCQMPK